MLRFSGVINNYNYSPSIRIVLHGEDGGLRVSSYQQSILFARRVDKNRSENLIDKNNLMHCQYTNTPKYE